MTPDDAKTLTTATGPGADEKAAQAARLAALRAELARRGLDGFLVPRADAHQGEYVSAASERLAWLTGFTGSAGMAAVLADKAAVFVDGRYTLQVRNQSNPDLFEFRHITEEPVSDWIAGTMAKGQVLGIDPWLHTERQTEALRKAVARAGASLRLLESNPIDAVWSDRPAPFDAPFVAHALDYAGKAAADKQAEVAEQLRKGGAGATVLTLPDSIAWLLNVRGNDVPNAPLPLSFAILRDDGSVQWFADPAKITAELRSHLGNTVQVEAPKAFGPALDNLAKTGKPVLADPDTAAVWAFERLRAAGATVTPGADPCQLPKACKNDVEIAGARAAHRRDGRAVVKFLAWLGKHAAKRASTDDPVDEIEAADKLAALRGENDLIRGSSFDTISGAGPNGAIVHYRVSTGTNRPLGKGELYLVDSGAQYLDGTTDITRTIAIGTPTAEMRDRFTRVLKGHIALAMVRFPRGVNGHQLDILARYHLWQAGIDFDHGTGHGVGSYLNVHEGPQRISKVPNTVALQPGMIISNEPGYYRTGAYGIRIENLVCVIESPRAQGEEKDMLAFETLTLAPIDRTLIETKLLSPDEIAWIDAYHARVRAAHKDKIDAETAAWLDKATAPISG
jgi:Xaa-Pro aminopeptidase